MDVTMAFELLIVIMLAIIIGHCTGLIQNRRQTRAMRDRVEQQCILIERLTYKLTHFNNPFATTLWVTYINCLQHFGNNRQAVTVDRFVDYLRNECKNTSFNDSIIFASLKEDGYVHIFIRSGDNSPVKVNYTQPMPQQLFNLK